MAKLKAKNIKTPKGVPISIGGVDLALKYDLNAMAELEDYYGDIEEAMKAVEAGNIKALRAVLWAGVIHDFVDEKGVITVTPFDVGAWINVDDLPALSKALSEALQQVAPKEEGDSPPPVPFEKSAAKQQKKTNK